MGFFYIIFYCIPIFFILLHVFVSLWLNYHFIRILVICFPDDRKYAYYPAVVSLQAFGVVCSISFLVLMAGMFSGSTLADYPILIVYAMPEVVCIFDFVLCLQRLFEFFGCCRWYRNILRYLILAMHFIVTPVCIYTSAFSNQRFTEAKPSASSRLFWTLDVVIRFLLSLFCVICYTAISQNIRRKSRGTVFKMCTTQDSALMIIYQALPIAIITLSTFTLSMYYMFFESERSLGGFSTIAMFLATMALGYAIPLSFLLANRLKRRLLISRTVVGCCLSQEDHTVVTGSTR